MRYWKVPSPVFFTSLGKFKSLKRWVTFKTYPRSLPPSNPERKFESCHPPFHELYELWIKQKIHYIFSTHSKNNWSIYSICTDPAPPREVTQSNFNSSEKSLGNHVLDFSVYLDSCKHKDDSLLLKIFLWHAILNTQLVVSHSINGTLNFTFILVVFVCLLLEKTECSTKHQGLQRRSNCFFCKTQAHRYTVSLWILP